MQRYVRFILPALASLLLTACGGGGNNGSTPPPTSAKTYTATLLAADVNRSADQQALPLTGLPADGATLTVE